MHRENLVHTLTVGATSFSVSVVEALTNETLAPNVVSWSGIRRPHHRAGLVQRTRADDDTQKFSKTTASETQSVETFRKLTPCSSESCPLKQSVKLFPQVSESKAVSQTQRRRQHEYVALKFHQFIYKGSTSRILPMDPLLEDVSVAHTDIDWTSNHRAVGRDTMQSLVWNVLTCFLNLRVSLSFGEGR